MTRPISRAPILTKHAQQRIAEMGLPYPRVVEVLRDPERDYKAPDKHGGDRGARIACADDLAVCYIATDKDPDRYLILTVLWDRPGNDGFKRGEEPPPRIAPDKHRPNDNRRAAHRRLPSGRRRYT